MKKILLTIILSIAIIFAFGQAQELAPIGGTSNVTLKPGITIPPLSAAPVIAWDNGPLVNSPGTGVGGADESVLQSTMSTLGFGFQSIAGNIIADDFVLAATTEITSILVYGYQTGSSTTSTINDVYIEIYDGEPGAGGSVVWGNMTTNRMVSSTWSGIYRVAEAASGSNTDRPIMECTCEINTSLPAGTYWLAIQMNGSLGSGPWCPPITITGSTTTGNAIQYISSGSSWNPAIDGYSLTQQGIPFVILSNPVVPFSINYILIVFALIGMGIILKRRFF